MDGMSVASASPAIVDTRWKAATMDVFVERARAPSFLYIAFIVRDGPIDPRLHVHTVLWSLLILRFSRAFSYNKRWVARSLIEATSLK